MEKKAYIQGKKETKKERYEAMLRNLPRGIWSVPYRIKYFYWYITNQI